jgi:dTDP-4-dehydrorhamnose 3,5-epimerase
MVFKETCIKGAYIIEIEPRSDERGFFGRAFCRSEYKKMGLNPDISQCSVSYNATRGILRGMHYQAAPYAEAKTIFCLAGSIYDVFIDLRPDSPTWKKWCSVELHGRRDDWNAARRLLYLPEGVAHGFQVMEDHTEVFYQISAPYHQASARGIRWNDPAFNIRWPEADRIISERDRSFPDFAG